jgi:hypothetical protein
VKGPENNELHGLTSLTKYVASQLHIKVRKGVKLAEIHSSGQFSGSAFERDPCGLNPESNLWLRFRETPNLEPERHVQFGSVQVRTDPTAT